MSSAFAYPLRLPGWKLAVHHGLSIKTEVLVVFDKETQHFEARCYDFDRKHPIQACGPDVPSLQKALDAAMKMISELKAKVAALTAELAEYKSVHGQLRTANLEKENSALRSKLHSYEDTISRNRLWSYFSNQKEKALPRNNVR